MKTVFKIMGWEERCLNDPDNHYKIVRVFDEWGFIITPLKRGAANFITSEKTYTSEIDAYEAAYKTVNHV